MPHLVILEIIRLSLELALEGMRGMPDEVKRAAWERHEKRIAFWENLFEKLQPKP